MAVTIPVDIKVMVVLTTEQALSDADIQALVDGARRQAHLGLEVGRPIAKRRQMVGSDGSHVVLLEFVAPPPGSPIVGPN